MGIYLIVFIIAWFTAQGLKYILQTRSNKEASLRLIITESGGMPSAHSAVVIAITTLILFREGIDSAVFGLAFTFAMIVLYDSMKVRYSTGLQSVAINEIIETQKLKMPKLTVVKGHTMMEVVIGSVIGLFIGYFAFILTN